MIREPKTRTQTGTRLSNTQSTMMDVVLKAPSLWLPAEATLVTKGKICDEYGEGAVYATDSSIFRHQAKKRATAHFQACAQPGKAGSAAAPLPLPLPVEIEIVRVDAPSGTVAVAPRARARTCIYIW